MRKGTTLAAFTAALGLFVLAGCGDQSAEEDLDDAAAEIEDAAEDAMEGAGEAIEEAGDAIKEATEDE